jgi:hypothetical protein
MIAAPVIPFGKVDQLPAHTGRPRDARQFAQSARHLPMMVAIRKLGRRFARRYQARGAHERRFRSNPVPSSAAHTSARLAGSGTALGVTVSVCSRTSAPQCRQFAGGDRRCHEPRPMSQQETKPFSDRCGMRPDQKPVRRIREISDQYPVEAGTFVNAGCLGDNLRIKRRSGRRDDLRRDPWRNPADHFHRHGDIFLN